MSLIHLDKSVLSFHFKEILEDGHVGGPITLVGLAVLVLGPKLLPNRETRVEGSHQARRPSASAYRPGMGLSAWVSQAQHQASVAKPEHRPTLTITRQAQTSERMTA